MYPKNYPTSHPRVRRVAELNPGDYFLVGGEDSSSPVILCIHQGNTCENNSNLIELRLHSAVQTTYAGSTMVRTTGLLSHTTTEA